MRTLDYIFKHHFGDFKKTLAKGVTYDGIFTLIIMCLTPYNLMAQAMDVQAQMGNDVPNILVSTPSLVLNELPKPNLQQASSNTSTANNIVNDGEKIDVVRVVGIPPTSQMRRQYTKSAVKEKVTASAVILPSVPAYYWSFGCAPTSAAMIAGYYDNMGYPNMYTGPTNNGVMPMTNAEWGLAEINGESWGLCPLSATRKGLDGRETVGHIDDYWTKSYSFDKDPYLIQGREPHIDGDCVADFMKSNQSKYSNPDGATNFQYGSEGRPYTGNNISDGGLGLQMFFESRGYSVVKRFNQYIHEFKKYVGNNQGFTFGQYVDEINAGRPVLIHFDNHTAVGIGYELSDSTIYIHDTWDYLTHQMRWGGTYYGLTHRGVTVIQLAPSNTILVKNSGKEELGIRSVSINEEWLSVSEKYTYPLIVAPGESKELTVVINWDLLGDEEQNASLTIASNDPDEPKKTISITAVPHKCAALEMPGIWMDMQPNCSCATGSVTLKNVPQNETYSILNTTTNKIIEGSGGFVATIDELIPGTYSFVVIDKWGCKSPESPKVVIRNQPVTPATPHVERNGNVLYSSSQTGNQWYNQDGPIQGANSPQYEVKESGTYFVVVTSNYCYSDPSNTVSVDYLNVDKIIFPYGIRLIPNPATDMFKINGLKNKAILKVFDFKGRMVLSKDVEDDEWISVSYLPSGIYFVQIVEESNVMTQKLVKQ